MENENEIKILHDFAYFENDSTINPACFTNINVETLEESPCYCEDFDNIMDREYFNNWNEMTVFENMFLSQGGSLKELIRNLEVNE